MSGPGGGRGRRRRGGVGGGGGFPQPRTHLHEDLHGALGDVQVAGAQIRPLVHGGGRVYEEEEDRHGPGGAPGTLRGGGGGSLPRPAAPLRWAPLGSALLGCALPCPARPCAAQAGSVRGGCGSLLSCCLCSPSLNFSPLSFHQHHVTSAHAIGCQLYPHLHIHGGGERGGGGMTRKGREGGEEALTRGCLRARASPHLSARPAPPRRGAPRPSPQGPPAPHGPPRPGPARPRRPAAGSCGEGAGGGRAPR